MTCKIDRIVGGTSLVILRISGRITEHDVDMIRAVLEPESSPVAIDLKQVLLADREAVRFLAACELNGTELRNCLAYIREWVTREGANKNASQGTGASEDSEYA
jgi:hypothetical protein